MTGAPAATRLTCSTDGTIRFNGMAVGSITTTSPLDDDPIRDLAECLATVRFVASVFDEWTATTAELLALYDGLDWSDAVPCAAAEIREARARRETP